MRRFALILLIMLIGGVAILNAATTGRLAVRVRDNQGKPIEFVNVVVMQGTRRVTGGQTNDKGTAIIINIPPGMYTVRFSLIGYDTYTFNDVRIQVDQTANLSPVMNKSGIRLATVVVTAEQDRVEKDRVGSSRQIEMDRISDVSVSDVAGIVSLQAGVTNIGGELHIRGGRANEINFTVDGMSVSDPVDGGSALQVDTDAISDMKVMTGGFPAEYGNAQSGVINIVTKDGDAFYSGKLEFNTDHLIGEGRNSDVIKFAFGGPIWPLGGEDLRERLTFYMNGGGEWLDGRLKDYYIGDPMQDYLFYDEDHDEDQDPYRQLLEYEYPRYDPYEIRDNFLGFDLGNRNYNSYNVNLKTKYVLSPTQRFTLAARGDRSFNLPLAYSWRYALHHYAFDQTEQRQYIGTYDHVFNSAMNLKVKASYYEKNSNSGPRGIDRDNYIYQVIDPDNPGEDYVDNVLMGYQGWNTVDGIGNLSDGVYSPDYDGDGISDADFLPAYMWTYRIASVEDPRRIPGFNAPGSIYSFFVDDQTTSLNARADFEYQINDTHLAKTGLEVIKHTIKKNQLQNFLNIYEDRFQASLRRVFDMDDLVWIPDPENPADSIYIKPTELHDIYETDDGIIIPIYKPDAYFNAAKEASGKRDGYQADPWQIAYYVQDKMEWEGMIVNAGLRFDLWYLGDQYKVLLDSGEYRAVEFDKDERLQVMVSPRLGVSHPITDRDVLRFAYNYQNQLPQMQFIFTSKTPADANVSDQAITVGNTNLEPQITVTYEVGLSHQLSDDYVIDMTAYYKNLYNYVSTIKENDPNEPQISWYKFISEDYGSARGIDIQLEKLMSNFNTWTIAYSLAWAQGNNSTTVIQDEATNLREFPLDWDVRHNMSVNYTFRIGRGEEFFIPFTDYILPLDDFSANLNWSFASGSPYTPQSEIGTSFLDTNSKRKDLTQQANLRLTKGITLSNKMNIRVFLDVENLFQNRNILTVYPKTGSPYSTGEIIADSNTGYTYPEVAFVYNKAIRNPAFTNNHRGVTLGVSFNF
ncbi:MAG: carboxypeptidase regulatory-like domain-containing protein [Candidatus Syntrophosphaera sp.]|nr:carboxypeptidase regulatory-like domain-containing protein [Candidatus Syntrophosphaera sp.]